MLMTIADLMTQPALVVRAESKICDAVKLLLSDSAPQLDVVDDEGRLLGSVPDYELLKAQMAGDDEMAVTRVMSWSGVQLDADATADFAAAVFRDGRYRRLPVVRDGRVVGQIDRRDVMRLLNAMSMLDETEETENMGGMMDRPESAIRGPRFSRSSSRKSMGKLSRS